MKSALVALFLFVVAGTGFAGDGLKTSTLTITDPNGRHHRVAVEVAADPSTRETGLMRRKYLGKDSGMLFVFPESRVVIMWMKDTLIPLDMLFIDSKGRVIKVERDAAPLDESIIGSGGSVKYVLELNAGYAAREGISKGAKVSGPALRFHADQ